jgi:transposase
MSESSAFSFAELLHFGGFDYAGRQHYVVVVDRAGSKLLSMEFDNNAEGLRKFLDAVRAFPKVAFTIETSCGADVERLLEANLPVYPINPKSAQRYRDRKSVAGCKSDELDAFSMADALRTDGATWRRLLPIDPLTQELRVLCRDEIHLIELRTSLINQLRAALHDYYPVTLEAFSNWVSPSAWDFVITFPTPAELVSAGKRKWQKFLYAHHMSSQQKLDERMALFAKAGEFTSPVAAVISAKSLLATTLAKQLRALEAQLCQYRSRITAMFRQHPDHNCFGSLPGAGEKLAPRLLAELGSCREVFTSAEALQAYAGTAPVTKKSGRSHVVHIRRACNCYLRSAVHLWADLSRPFCVWAEAYYQQKRKQGIGHAAALRCLGQRWLNILWRIWQNRTAYNEAIHLRNQVQHGSWIVHLLPPSESPSTT